MLPSTVNNENDYRITRSRKHMEHHSSSRRSTLHQEESQSHESKIANGATHPESQDDLLQPPVRLYLNDVSNLDRRHWTLGESVKHTGGNNASGALTTTSTTTSNINTTGRTSNGGRSSGPVPARMPQKRQATESSTNLTAILNNKKTKLAEKTKVDYEYDDLDAEDYDDPAMCHEYVVDIFNYFAELETRMLPDPQYLYKQRHLKPKMRSILVDWLVDMHLRFRLLPESLFLAINIMDRFMSVEVVQVDKLQLLATASLFIAAKYEEVFSPLVKNYAYFTDGASTEEEILQAEKYILTILDFDLNYPNPMNFLRRILKADDYDVQSRTLGKYLVEITAVDYKFIGMKPSLCCASAMYLARLILGKEPVWTGNLIHYSGGYTVNDMKHCVGLLFQYLIAPVEHDEFFRKYTSRKFMKASLLCRSWAKKFHQENKDLFNERLSTTKRSFEATTGDGNQ